MIFFFFFTGIQYVLTHEFLIFFCILAHNEYILLPLRIYQALRQQTYHVSSILSYHGPWTELLLFIVSRPSKVINGLKIAV